MLDVETTWEDYTIMTKGDRVDGGVIAKCPRCGRLGRYGREDGLRIYEHRRTGPDETRETCVI